MQGEGGGRGNKNGASSHGVFGGGRAEFLGGGGVGVEAGGVVEEPCSRFVPAADPGRVRRVGRVVGAWIAGAPDPDPTGAGLAVANEALVVDRIEALIAEAAELRSLR